MISNDMSSTDIKAIEEMVQTYPVEYILKTVADALRKQKNGVNPDDFAALEFNADEIEKVIDNLA